MTLQEWFDSKERDYGLGVALLGKYSKNRMLLQNLARKQNPGKLAHELKKALDRLAALEAAEKAAVKNKKPEPQKIEGTSRDIKNADMDKLIIVRENKEVKFEDLPKVLQEKWEANRDAYKEIRATHEKLKLMGEHAPATDRAPLIRRIAELDTLIRSNWDIIDAWKPGQKVEDPQKKDAVTTGIDHKRIQANRKYISTNMKKLAAEADKKKADKLRAKIQERVTELKTANEEMKPETISELKKLGIEC